MKKKFALLSPVILLCLAACGEVKHNISEYFLEMDYHDDFKILQLSDIHIANKDDQQRQFDFIDLTINDKDAKDTDLIVLSGDSFTFADKTSVKRVFSWLDSHKIPWTMTFGNHDEQTYFPIDWLTGYLNELSESKDSYCIFKDIQDDDVFGNANFAINLKQAGDIKYQVILIDSNRYCFGDYWGYDKIHDNQVQWYSDLVDYTTSRAGHVVKSVAFFHIPLPEMQVAYDLALKEKETGVDNPDVEFVRENIGEPEPCSCPKIDPDIKDLFEVMVEKQSTVAMFYGHDHVNNYAVKYKGITMCYGINSTDRIYFEPDRLGGQTVTLKADGSFEIKQILHGYDEY